MGLGYGDIDRPFDLAAYDEMIVDYSPDQPRDKDGKWTNGGVYDKPTGTFSLNFMVTKSLGLNKWLREN